MPSRVVNWLSEKENDFGELSDEAKTEIEDFTLLWTYFEATRLNSNGGIRQIRTYVKGLSEETLEQIEVEDLVSYFRDRYINGENATRHYEALKLGMSGDPEEVGQMLQDNTDSHTELLIGCLGIIYRYRCNLFHGEKWRYHIRGQRENFLRSNTLLMTLMEKDT